jgi:hypothetical protein
MLAYETGEVAMETKYFQPMTFELMAGMGGHGPGVILQVDAKESIGILIPRSHIQHWREMLDALQQMYEE